MPPLETERRFQTNALNSYLKNQEKLEQNKPKLQKREEIIKIRTEISETENKNNRENQWNKKLVLQGKKINKTDKLLVRLTSMRREKNISY